MADVQRFRHVRAAEIHNDGLLFERGKKQARIRRHCAHLLREERVLQREVDKARRGGCDGGEAAVGLQPAHNVARDHNRSFAVLLGGSHGAIALELAQVGTVGHRYLAVLAGIAGVGKGGGHKLRKKKSD